MSSYQSKELELKKRMKILVENVFIQEVDSPLNM